MKSDFMLKIIEQKSLKFKNYYFFFQIEKHWKSGVFFEFSDIFIFFKMLLLYWCIKISTISISFNLTQLEKCIHFYLKHKNIDSHACSHVVFFLNISYSSRVTFIDLLKHENYLYFRYNDGILWWRSRKCAKSIYR